MIEYHTLRPRARTKGKKASKIMVLEVRFASCVRQDNIIMVDGLLWHLRRAISYERLTWRTVAFYDIILNSETITSQRIQKTITSEAQQIRLINVFH